MGIKYKLKLKDLKFEYLKEYFIPFLKYFKKTKKIENYSDLKEFIQKKSAWVSQVTLYGYLKTRMGAKYVLMFEDEIFLGSIKIQRKLAPKYRDVRNKAGLLASRLNNNLSGILTIKSFTKEKWELNRLNKESLDYQRSNKAAIKLSSAFIPLIRFAILFAFIAIL